jgi:hypothetical protein
MRGILTGCIIVAVALAGCANAIIVGVMVADGMDYYRLGPDGRTSVRASEADPTRRINAQDCTRPVDPNAGNLLCR